VELIDDKITVLTNHPDSEMSDDDAMVDEEEDAVDEIVGDDMDEDIYD
jgi:hypothetical protein